MCSMWPDDQKEGNGNLNIVLFALFRQVKFLHPKYFIMKGQTEVGRKRNEETYTNNCRVVGDRRGEVLLCRRALFDPQVLDICAAEDDVFVDLIGGRKLVVWVAPATFGAERPHIFERNCGIVRVDVCELTDISNVAL